MSDKIHSKRNKKDQNINRIKKLKRDLRDWLLFTVLYVIIAALVLGTASVHFPEPIHVFSFLYIDVAYAVFMLILTLYVVITGVIFRK